MKKIAIMLGIIVGSFAIIAVISIVVFVTSAPQFGQAPDDESRERYKSFQYFNGEKFENAVETNMDMNVSS